MPYVSRECRRISSRLCRTVSFATFLAGEFNNWNPKAEGFKLNKIGENFYQLTVKAENLGKRREKKQFKFVVNETFWIGTAKQALNVIKDAHGNTNLFIELNY